MSYASIGMYKSQITYKTYGWSRSHMTNSIPITDNQDFTCLQPIKIVQVAQIKLYIARCSQVHGK